MIGRLFWRAVDAIDRLTSCPHELVNKRGLDGSLWRVCSKCDYSVQLMAKANVVPLHPPTGRSERVRPKAQA